MAVTLKQALQTLESGTWCRLRFITANTAKGTGGKVMELKKCRYTQRPARKPAALPSAPKEGRRKKAPRHHEHFTRNLETAGKRIVKIHPILITHINNVPVV